MTSSTQKTVLPRHIDPRKFAQQGININGDVDLDELVRVKSLLASSHGTAYADLKFGVDEQGIRNLTGSIKATVEMVCQRCLEAASQSLHIDLSLGFVWKDEDAEKLPKAYEPWIIGEGQSDIYDVVADELILSLPIVAYHDQSCIPQELFSSKDTSGQSDVGANSKDTSKPNPFQVLEQLKGSLSKASDKIDE
jgi:uncharacterized protein